MTKNDNTIILNNEFFSKTITRKKDNSNIISEDFKLITDSNEFSKATDGKSVKLINPQLELIISGSADYLIDYNKYPVKNGMLIIYPQYTVWMCNNRSRDFRSVWFDCNFSEIYNYEILYYLRIIDTLSTKDINYITQYFDILKQTAQYNDTSYKSVTYMIMALLNLLNVTIETNMQISGINKRSIEIYKIFMQLLRQNYDFSLTIDDYADRLCISKSHLRNTVKQITGKSIMQIINKEIIRKSKILLSDNLSVKKTVERLNCTDYAYFHQFFKKETGITPSEFAELKARL